MGKALEIPKAFAGHQTVRDAVLRYNKKAENPVFECTVRNLEKDNETTFVFRKGDF